MTGAALDLDAIDAGWTEPPSGVRATPAKPPKPLKAMSLEEVVALFLRARFEAESRMDAGDRVVVELGDERIEVVMVADRLNPAGEIVARGGVRVERPRERR